MQTSVLCLGVLSVVAVGRAVPFPGASPFAAAMAGPYPYPGPQPLAAPLPAALPAPVPGCCGSGQCGCGLGLCSCCGDTYCENGACAPIINYADGFYGAPRIQGGYGNTYGYGR